MKLVLTLVFLGMAAVGFCAHAQGPVYYSAQVGGGTIAALAGGVAGTLLGGISGVLFALPIELARNPRGIYQEWKTETWEALEERAQQEPLPVRWGFTGAKVGFGLGVSIGAALGVIWVGQLFGIEGNPHGAFTGAFAGSLVGMILLAEPQKYPFSFQGWHCRRVEEKDKNMTRFECGYESQSMEPTEVLLSPMALAALGATIGYNARISVAVSMPIVSARF